jgi:hypothetical protein
VYSRVTQLEIDTLRVDIADAVDLFRSEVVPRLHEQQGYEGAVVLTTAEGSGMLVTLWETPEAADAASGFATEQVERYMTLFRAPPGREHYEVSFFELPGVAVS